MVYIPMKRTREGEMQNLTNMANYLMLLSKGTNTYSFDSTNVSANKSGNAPAAARVFECKTCNRQFPSFQALGGHRASHKKPRFMVNGSDMTTSHDHHVDHQTPPAKPKTHECSICGLEFAIGQALGGHMRRHRAAAATNENVVDQAHHHHEYPPDLSLAVNVPQVPVLKRANSGRRVFGLDLNLTPLENGLDQFGINIVGKVAPPALVELCL